MCLCGECTISWGANKFSTYILAENVLKIPNFHQINILDLESKRSFGFQIIFKVKSLSFKKTRISNQQKQIDFKKYKNRKCK